MQDDVTLENRKLIFDYISDNPGVHLRKISRDMNIHLSTLRYHIDYLEIKGLITYQKEDNLKLYFVCGKLNPHEKKLASLLQQKRFRDILIAILDSHELTSSKIAEKLSMNRSTASKYINILEKREIISHKKIGREKLYQINDEESVVKLLLTYKKSLWDSFVDNVLELYLER
ncbi:MarR family protein [uncultured archaeon]|nr:MarR family protein [uncultured archaeon]